MGSKAVDVEFGAMSKGKALRAEMGGEGGDATFARLFARCSSDDRERLLAALHRAVVAGSCDELVEIDGRRYRVRGDVAGHSGVVEGSCQEIAR